MTDTGSLLQIRDLGVEFDVDGARHVGVKSVSLDIARGEVVAIVGESGSGKTVTAMSILGLLPKNATVSGSVRFDGRELCGLSERELRGVRGRAVGMVFQDPVAALDPVFTIGFQIGEVVRLAEPRLSGREVRRRSAELLSLVGIEEPAERLGDYPHQFSGGQCQRIAIAMVLAESPALIVADEPTTALDVTVQAEVLDVLRQVKARLDSAIMLITHNMGVVADLADRVVVMRSGEVVEINDCIKLFESPSAPYTADLLAAVPRITAAPREVGESGETQAAASDAAVLDVRGLAVEYRRRPGGRVRAVDGVDLKVERGQIVGLVGESGSGKTTIGRAIIGLAPIAEGQVNVAGRDVAALRRAERQAMRRTVGVVFQNPATSLNPRYSVAETITEPLRRLGGMSRADAAERADDLLASVGLDARWRDRYPHELSGGQRQRVAIARAVALDPALLIADEPTSALDVSVQARVLDVLRDLQERLGFACLFISHDLAVVDSVADYVAVMHHGRIVEQGDRATVLGSPRQDYTRRLVASAPIPDPVAQRARRETWLSLT
ncbi:MAG: ABC transporter ATP-binding protein [Bifidobacteriaceae bacterium]|jgi:peptide/nickel transport system ATP-binding protein|nr:ABC transporter ATP-binding protein [Bifidobacteriaceae bacterium]